MNVFVAPLVWVLEGLGEFLEGRWEFSLIEFIDLYFVFPGEYHVLLFLTV